MLPLEYSRDKMTWSAAVEVALQRRATSNNSAEVTNEQLRHHELAYIYVATRCKGKTPRNTLDRVLQDMRKSTPCAVAFGADGHYTYLKFRV